jgi:multiple sugar transport system ATP-binding protein
MTSQIEIRKLEKFYGAYHALKTIDLDIKKGSFVALVGPSGCGKSTLLRTLAGLESISSGDISIENADVTHVPPRKRDVAMVFQSYALYPHMTVEDNLTYSLRWKKVSKADRRRRAAEVAASTGLSDLLKRYPRELSGGQRQRVAMGRAIIRNPKAFLFDEPLSNLDAALRVQMRKEIRALHNRLGATSVYVTHDQIEAMTMADHVVVMRAGVIEQQGSPLELYDRPVNRFVAGFIGSPAMNFVDARVGADGKSLVLDLGGSQTIAVATELPAGRAVTVGLRPEHMRLASGDETMLTFPVESVENTGSSTYLAADGAGDFNLVVNGRTDVRPGDKVGVAFDAAQMHLFDAQTGLRL